MRTETRYRKGVGFYTLILYTLRELVEKAMWDNDGDTYIVGAMFDNTDYNEEYCVNDDFPNLFYGADDDAWYIWTWRYIYIHRYYDGESKVEFIPRYPCKLTPKYIGDG